MLRKVQRLRLQHLQRNNPRRSTVAVTDFQLKQTTQTASLIENSNVTSGVLLRKQRRDRQRKVREMGGKTSTRCRRSNSSEAAVSQSLSKNERKSWILESTDVSKMGLEKKEFKLSNIFIDLNKHFCLEKKVYRNLFSK